MKINTGSLLVKRLIICNSIAFSLRFSYFCIKVAFMKLSLFSDKLGICASVACLVHCLIVPFLLIIGFDVTLYSLDQEWIEMGFIFSSLLIGIYAFIKGFLSHRQHFVPVLFLAGFLLLVNGEKVANTLLAVILSVIGALIIVYAHFQNLKLKQLHVSGH